MSNSYYRAADIFHLSSIFIEVNFFFPVLSIMNYHDRLVNLVCINCVHSINRLIQLAVSNGMYINNSQLCSLPCQDSIMEHVPAPCFDTAVI